MKPVDLQLGVTGSPGRAVAAGDILTVRASIQKRTTTGGAATSFKFLYNLSGGLKLVGITTNAGNTTAAAASPSCSCAREADRLDDSVQVERVELGRIRRQRAPGAGWRETKAANNDGVRRWTVGPPPKPSDLGVRSPTATLILRGSPNTYTVTVTNKGPTTVTRLRLRVVTRLVSPSYDNAKGGYNPRPASGPVSRSRVAAASP